MRHAGINVGSGLRHMCGTGCNVIAQKASSEATLIERDTFSITMTVAWCYLPRDCSTMPPAHGM